MTREIFKFLASLKLAMLLLAVIIVATAFGTYYESAYNADVARRMVYSHWWFDAWLTMLCANLFCVAAVRYPWKPHQRGFVITHAGIIVLLVGSLIDRHFGIEGSIGLRRGQVPTHVMELRDQELILIADEKSEPGRTPFKVNALLSEADCKFPLNSPDPAIQAEVLDILPMMIRNEAVEAEDGQPMLHLTLRGAQMGQHDIWLTLGDVRQMLPGVYLGFLNGLPGKNPAGVPTQIPDKKPDGKKAMVPRQERHTVFKLHDPTVVTSVGESTGAKTKLKLDDNGANPELTLELLDKTFVLKLNEVVEKKTELEGLAPWSIFVYGYYPNYRLSGSKPTTLNKNPDNPAVVFELEGPLVPEPDHVGGKGPHGGAAPHAGGHAGQQPGEDYSFTFYLGDDAKLRFRNFSKSAGETVGEVLPEKPIAVSWGAAQAEIIPLNFIPKGKMFRRWVPAAVAQPNRFLMLKNQRAGALVEVRHNNDAKKVWVPMTQPYGIFDGMKMDLQRDWDGSPLDLSTLKTPVEVGGRTVSLSFSNRSVPLPFSLQLKRFHAPHVEGMEANMAFIKFESVLSFNGAKDSVRVTAGSQFMGGRYTSKDDPMLLVGAVIEQSETEVKMTFDDRSEIALPRSEIVSINMGTQYIGMNSPTTFPIVWHGPWFGTTYKFSQADHRLDRGDADYSGVQVLRDPGWFPKWFGCIMICSGIFTMFYLKPYMAGRRNWQKEQARAAAAAKADVVAQPPAAADENVKDKGKKVAQV